MRIELELTDNEAEAVRRFLARDFGIIKKLTQYPETVALMKIQNALEGWEFCVRCETEQLDADIWREEFGMCVECSHAYYAQGEEGIHEA